MREIYAYLFLLGVVVTAFVFMNTKPEKIACLQPVAAYTAIAVGASGTHTSYPACTYDKIWSWDYERDKPLNGIHD